MEFNETVDVIKNFKYSRYKPLTYLKDTKKYATLLAAQHNMGGFMKSILVKRLESSFFAFKNTLARFQQSYEKFLEMYDAGEVYISKKVDVYDLLDTPKAIGKISSSRLPTVSVKNMAGHSYCQNMSKTPSV